MTIAEKYRQKVSFGVVATIHQLGFRRPKQACLNGLIIFLKLTESFLPYRDPCNVGSISDNLSWRHLFSLISRI